MSTRLGAAPSAATDGDRHDYAAAPVRPIEREEDDVTLDVASKPAICGSDLGAYQGSGLDLIPLHHWLARDTQGKPRGKTPRDPGWRKRRYDPDQVVAEAIAKGSNVGVRLTDEFLVIDVDPRSGGDASFEHLRIMYGSGWVDTCPQVITGSGGRHYYLRKPADLGVVYKLKDYPGIEFKTAGGQVVAAGSIHPAGIPYRWAAPPDFSRMEAPVPLLNLLKKEPLPDTGRDWGEGFGETPTRTIVKNLDQLDPCDFRVYEDWLAVAMVCHHASGGDEDMLEEFIKWCAGDPLYADAAESIREKWRSFRPKARAVTIRTLFKKVIDAGGQPIDAESTMTPEERQEAARADFDEVGSAGKPKEEIPGLDRMIDKMNEAHFVVNDKGKFRVMTEVFDPDFGFDLDPSSKVDFLDIHRHPKVRVPGRHKEPSLAELWLDHPRRRQYSGIDFDPSGVTKNGVYNLWRGYKIKPEPGDWSLLMRLIKEGLAAGDDDSAEFILNWLAYMLQYPHRLPGVALCLRGEKGTGKSTLGRALIEIIGSTHSHAAASQEQMSGRFNAHLNKCMFLFADEAFWAGDHDAEARLKQLLTEPKIAYEAKYQNARMGKNCIHIMMASNSDWMVPASGDERRYAVLDVCPKFKGDKEFWNALNAQMENGGLAAMLYDLLSRDIQGWEPREHVPQNEALAEQKRQSLNPVAAFWQDLLTSGEVEGLTKEREPDWVGGPVTFIKASLRGQFLGWMKDNRPRSYDRPDEREFGRRLRKLVNFKSTQVRVDRGFDIDGGKAQAYVVPSIAECREQFDRHLGIRTSWPAVADVAE